MEIWKDIAGYEGLYQVSDYGNVKSLSKIVGIGREKTRQEQIALMFNTDQSTVSCIKNKKRWKQING